MVNFFYNSIHSSQNIYTTRDHELVNRVRLGLKYIPLASFLAIITKGCYFYTYLCRSSVVNRTLQQQNINDPDSPDEEANMRRVSEDI
jgi:hypothetical protein